MLNGHGTEVAVVGGGEGAGHVLIIIIHHNDNNIIYTVDYGVRVYTRIYYDNNVVGKLIRIHIIRHTHCVFGCQLQRRPSAR